MKKQKLIVINARLDCKLSYMLKIYDYFPYEFNGKTDFLDQDVKARLMKQLFFPLETQLNRDLFSNTNNQLSSMFYS